MKIIKSKFYLEALKAVLRYIALDNPSAALAFNLELEARLELIKTHPEMCRASRYHSSNLYRDLIYKGYTIIYKLDEQQIILLDIFRGQDKEQL